MWLDCGSTGGNIQEHCGEDGDWGFHTTEMVRTINYRRRATTVRDQSFGRENAAGVIVFARNHNEYTTAQASVVGPPQAGDNFDSTFCF